MLPPSSSLRACAARAKNKLYTNVEIIFLGARAPMEAEGFEDNDLRTIEEAQPAAKKHCLAATDPAATDQLLFLITNNYPDGVKLDDIRSLIQERRADVNASDVRLHGGDSNPPTNLCHIPPAAIWTNTAVHGVLLRTARCCRVSCG